MNSLRFYIVFFSFTMFQASAYGMLERVKFANVSDSEIDRMLQIQRALVIENLKKAFNRPTFDENGNYRGNLDDSHEVISVAELKDTEGFFSNQPGAKKAISIFKLANFIPEELPLQVVVEGFSREERIKFAKLLAARVGYKYKYIDADLLYTGQNYSEADSLREEINPLIELSKPCVVILDRLMSLVKQKGNEGHSEPIAVGALCYQLDQFEKRPGMLFIGLRGDTSAMQPRLESRLQMKFCLNDPNEAMWQTMYNYLFKQPTDS